MYVRSTPASPAIPGAWRGHGMHCAHRPHAAWPRFAMCWMAGYHYVWSIEAGRALRVAATHEVGTWLLAWIFLLASLPALLVGVWSACSRPLLGGRSSTTTTSMLEASRPASQTAGLPVGALVDAADRPGPRMHKLEEALIDDSRHRVVPHVGKVLLVWWHVIHLGPFARAERRSTRLTR